MRQIIKPNPIFSRGFQVSSIVQGRLRKRIELRPPIVPKVSSIEVEDNHPLWQFFSDKKYIRSKDDLDQVGMYESKGKNECI